MADEVLPISMPSPSLSMEQVSTQTRSPIPTGLIFVTLNGTRPTFPVGDFISAATDFTMAGLSVFRRMPCVPFSSTWSAICASFSSFTFAMICVGLRHQVLERDDRPVAGRHDDEGVLSQFGRLVLALPCP